ncbi:MAG: DUF86 domain-containing protein [Saprospiraceae bacterium]|nr:DUF86 domain-containing protein [Saprospiraceae bacterium]
MTEQAKKYLSDILAAIGLVEEFSKDSPTFPSYQADLKTKSAVERQLEILGEAVNKYSKETPEFPLSNVPRIISFRNRLAHNYDNVDDAIVWAVMKEHLPVLKQEATEYLEK